MLRVARLTLSFALSLVVVAALGADPANATVEHNPENQFVDQDFCIQPMMGSACYHGGAQTFTAAVSGELFALHLPIYRESFTTTTRDLSVELRADAPDGAVLATSVSVPAESIPIGLFADWILVEFPTPVTITAGQVYAIVIPIDPMSATADPAWGWGKSATDTYAGGVAWGGVAPSSWEPYADGSDLAFQTHVRTGPPVCDFALVVGATDVIQDHVTFYSNNRIEFFGIDFGSHTDVTVEVVRVPAGGEPFFSGTSRTVRTDIDGNFEGDLVFKVRDSGTWRISAYPSDDPTCADGVDAEVLFRQLNFVPPPTPVPPAVTGELPNTSMQAPAPIAPSPGVALVILSLASLAAGHLLRRQVRGRA